MKMYGMNRTEENTPGVILIMIVSEEIEQNISGRVRELTWGSWEVLSPPAVYYILIVGKNEKGTIMQFNSF